MARNISSIKDFVIPAMTNSFTINEEAKSNDAVACFQMGMMYLLGINTSIDLKKASSYFSNQSLANNPDANRLLGFIAELEGDYSLAFNHYFSATNADNSSEKQYLHKVAAERENLKNYLKELELPNEVVNGTLSTILENYLKDGKQKLKSSIQIAIICRDETSCAEAIQTLCEAGDHSTAKKILQLCDIDLSKNAYIMRELFEKKEAIMLTDHIQVIDIEGSSLLTEFDYTPYFNKVKDAFDKLASQCYKLWLKDVSNLIPQIKNKLKEEQKELLRKQKEEENQALLEQQAEEEAKARKRKNIIAITAAVLSVIIFGPFGIVIALCILLYLWYSNRKNRE